MSIDFGAWLGGNGSIVQPQIPMRAAIQWARIQDKPVDVVFRTANNVSLAPQTVRIEWDNPATEAESAAGVVVIRKGTIFGIRGHPDLDDTDVRKGYRFNFEGKQYVVLDPLLTHGQVQAKFEAG